MNFQQIIYLIVVFVLSLLIHAFSLFISAKLFNRGTKHGFNKALRILLHVYLSIFVMWVIGQLAIWLISKIGLGGDLSVLARVIMILVFILSVVYYFKEIKSSYRLSTVKTILLIALMWIINLAILYFIDMFVSPIFKGFGIPFYGVFFNYWLPF